MNRPSFVVLAVAVTTTLALAACQSILGIEDVQITDGGSTTDGSGSDATANDACSDVADDASQQDAMPPADSGAADTAPRDASEASVAMCEIACANSNPSGVQDLLADGGGMCLCGPSGACSSACAGSVCNQPPMMPSATCVDCLGPAFLSPNGACHADLVSCGSACSAIGSCAQSCGAP